MTLHQHSWFSTLALGVALAFIATYSFIYRSRDKAQDQLWQTLDAVGVSNRGLMPWTKAILLSVVKTAQNTREGYERFCKGKTRPFALPNIWTGGAVVVLPPSLLHLLNKPDSELAAHRAQHETIQLPYMVADREVYDNPIHFDVVRRTMSRKQVGTLATATAEELDRAFSAYWPQSIKEADGKGGWSTMNNWNACGRVISQTAMRVLVGKPLCRDQRLLKLSTQYADAVIMGTGLINCLPPSLRPWLGPLIALPAKYHQGRCLKILRPVIEERAREWESKKSFDAHGVPNDFLQWMIERCAKAGPDQADATRIAMRLLSLATMSVMGMVWVLSHCIQDLYGNPNREEFLAGLEEECKHSILSGRNGAGAGALGSKDTIDRLYRIDSTIRESMRLSSIGVISLARDVVAEEMDLGLDDGLKIPKGVRVVFPTQAMHKDAQFSFNENPLEFDAFRFSRDFESTESMEKSVFGREAASLTVPSESFLAWGYGKHACTGRWYAAQTLKQALAYIIMNYDVKVLGTPREKKALLNVVIPHTDVQIQLRRK